MFRNLASNVLTLEFNKARPESPPGSGSFLFEAGVPFSRWEKAEAGKHDNGPTSFRFPKEKFFTARKYFIFGVGVYIPRYPHYERIH